jgi:hypothetical protein
MASGSKPSKRVNHAAAAEKVDNKETIPKIV